MFFIKRDIYKSFAKLTVGVSRLINLQYITSLGTAFRKNHVTYNLLRFAKKISILCHLTTTANIKNLIIKEYNCTKNEASH